MGLQSEVETRQLEQLIQAVDDLRRRVTALEQRQPPPNNGQSLLAFPEPAGSVPVAGLPTGLLPAIGRLLLGIAGAYFLRAITEAHVLPQLAGTLLGLAYAAAWLLSFLRYAPSDRVIVALQGLTASLIAGPLVWESTIRFHSLSPGAAALALAIFIIIGQVVGWRPNLALIAGVTALAGSVTAVALIVTTLNPVPFAIAVAVGVVVVELGAGRDRALSMRGIIAIAADFCAFLLIYVRTRPQGLPEGYAAVPVPVVLGILIALAVTYVGSIVARTLVRRLPIGWFEIFQVAAAVCIPLTGVLQITHVLTAPGAACLAAGAICYLASFTKLLARTVIGRNFHAYAIFGLLLTSAGILLLFSGAPVAAIGLLLALFATWLGEHGRGNTIRVHGAFYFVASGWSSGLLAYTSAAMIGSAKQNLSIVAVICAMAIAGGYALTLAHSRVRTWTERIAPAIIAALLCWTAAGLLSSVLTTPFDAALSSSIRTALICSIGVGLAWFGRRRNVPELIWLLYPWMAFGVVKLLAEDFRQGSPATLFLSLLLYGGTLIALPRLWRRAKSA